MSQSQRDAYCERRFKAFDTIVSLRAYGDGPSMDHALAQAEQDCRRYERLFSRTLPNTDVSRLNQARGAWVQVDPCTFEVVAAALEYCEQSEGVFDITIGAASSLWDLKHGVAPRPEALEEAVAHVDWRVVELDERTCRVRLADPDACVDLGGIAKGWIADALGKVFAKCVTGYVVDLGGNILVGGEKPGGEPWKVGLKDPGCPKRLARQITLRRGSVVTSGTYERSHVIGGVEYHHILDPRTGMPVPVEHKAATVVCERSLDAEGFSTTLLILGPKRAQTFKTTHPEILQVYFL